MTKLSLYKVEVRLQKLEEFTYETISQLNTIANLIKLNANQNSTADIVSDSKSSVRSRLGEDSGDFSSENPNNLSFRRPTISRDNSRSSMSKKSGSVPLMPPPLGGEFNTSVMSRRRKHLLSGDAAAASAILGEQAASKIRRSSFRKRSEKLSDDELREDAEESKYLRKITKKIMSKKPMKEDDSLSSSSSTPGDEKRVSKQQRKSRIKIKVEDYEATTENKTKPVKFLGERECKEGNKRERKISFTVPVKKGERSPSSSSSSSYSDTKTTRKMLKEIYRNQLDEQQQFLSLAASQSAYTLDQYTIHPFVYLHSVVKPPLAEYTSITDCIDTTNIDRPPSPSMSLSKSNVFFSNLKPGAAVASTQPVLQQLQKQQQSKLQPASTVPVCKDLNSSINDFTAGVESTRSIVARQESEILRLVEESQHVIISQMLNKIVHNQNLETTPLTSSSPDTNANNTTNTSDLAASRNDLDESRLTDESTLENREQTFVVKAPINPTRVS
jgi:hypothetical protein